MKRFFTLFFIIFIFFSCKKQDSVNPEANQSQSTNSVIAENVLSQNNRLVFHSLEDYELYVSDSSKKSQLIAATNSTDSYISISRYASDANLRKAASSRFQSSPEIVDSLYPEFLTYILNPDGIVQIGDYIIKVDMQNKRALVLNSIDSLYYEDLVSNNLANENIRIFSTDDDVLDLLSNEKAGMKTNGLFCKEKGIGDSDSNKDKDYLYYGGNGYRLDCKVVYQKAAIYFSLQAKVIKQYQGWTGIWTSQQGNLQIQYYYVYKAKCESQIGPFAGKRNPVLASESNFRPYESSKALHKAWFIAKFYDLSAQPFATTREFSVKRGY